MLCARVGGVRIGASILTSLALAGGVTGALAQDARGSPDASVTVSPLVVTPSRPPMSHDQLVKAVDSFVRARQTITRVERIARWRAPVCVETLGLPEAMNTEITTRIVQVGTAAGAPLAQKNGCKANVEVVFTAEPQPFIDLIAKRQWLMLGYHYASQTHRITRIVRPIQAWYVTGTRSSGNGAAVAGTAAEGTVGTGQIAIDDPLNRAPGGEAGSRLNVSLASEFANVLIVVDQTKVVGQSTQAIADYAAVLALAPVANLNSCGALTSILDLLADCDPARNPETLTPSDLAFLKALYSVNLRLEGALARSQIEAAIRRDFGSR